MNEQPREPTIRAPRLGARPAALLLAAAAVSCGGSEAGTAPTDDPRDPVASVTVAPAGLEVEIGATGTLGATVTTRSGADVTASTPVTWSSVPSSVATVSGSGATASVTGIAEGSADIRATAGGLTGSTTVTVVEPPPPTEPPFGGTIFVDPDIITASDATTFDGLEPAGKGERTMYDRRAGAFITLEAWLFDATFADGLTAEVQVNPEIADPDVARAEAEKYAEAIGRLPTALRADVETVWIHRGTQPFGGGNRNILIHTGQADLYVQDGILEETLVHEATHTSLDDDHADAPGWVAAQAADPTFISDYARDHPTREDLAETFLLWLAVRHRADRIDDALARLIERAIPNRIDYLDAQGFDLFPIE